MNTSPSTSRDYAFGLKYKRVIVSTSAPLSKMFDHFHVIRTCHSMSRYFDWDGKGETGDQQGDPLENVNLSSDHPSLMGTYASKVPSPSLAYADDGYIKDKMSVALQVLADLTEHVLKEETD